MPVSMTKKMDCLFKAVHSRLFIYFEGMCSQINIKMTKVDDFLKSHQICFRWLSKNFDIQGAVIFQVRDNTYGMSSA
jgi:hypothetical protein